MLNTKGQKFKMFLIGVISLLLGAVILVPFKSVFFHEKILMIELITKLCVIPVLMLLLSITPNKLKYAQVAGYRNQSRIVSVMSYFPIFIYILAIIVGSLYLITQGYILNGSAVPEGVNVWPMWFIGITVFAVGAILFFHYLPKFEMLLDTLQHVIFDLLLLFIAVGFGVFYHRALVSTHELFAGVGIHGDPILLVKYIAALVFIGYEFHFICRLIADDEVNVTIRFNDLDCTEYVSRMAEYNRAYADIMDGFEEFFENEDELECDEECECEECECHSCEEEPAAEVKAEEPAAEVKAEAQLEPVDQETVEEIDRLEAEVQELKEAQEKAEALEAQRAKEREEAAREAYEKALQNKAEMRPTFAELVSYARSLDQVSSIENKEKAQVKFFIGKKLFLIIADTDRDYRLQFNVNPLDVVEWWTINPEIRPRSNKTDNWYKLVNKGTFTKELLFDIVLHAHDFMIKQIEDVAKAKEALKLAKAEARKAAKANK